MSTRRAAVRKPAAAMRMSARKRELESAAGDQDVESTRERILTSATRLFAELGFEGSSMPAIAKASGITAGAIYKHFESKGELLLEVVRRSFLSSPLLAHSSERENDATALPFLAELYTEPQMKLVRQLSIEVHSAAAKDPKVRQVLSQSDQLAMKGISESVMAAQKAGKLNPDLNPDHVARAFCIFVMGLTHMDTLLPDLIGDHAWRDFVRDRVAAMIGMH